MEIVLSEQRSGEDWLVVPRDAEALLSRHSPHLLIQDGDRNYVSRELQARLSLQLFEEEPALFVFVERGVLYRRRAPKPGQPAWVALYPSEHYYVVRDEDLLALQQLSPGNYTLCLRVEFRLASKDLCFLGLCYCLFCCTR